MRNFVLLFVLSTVMGLAGCATPTTVSPQGNATEINQEVRKQKELALARQMKEDKRVKEAAYPILKANVALCKNTAFNLGASFWNFYTVPEGYREVATSHFGVTDALEVQAVYKDSPAFKAGIRAEDVLVAINGEPVPAGKKASLKAAELMGASDKPSIEMTFKRGAEEFSKTIQRAPICGYGVVYHPENSSVNAFADGENIHMSRGMLRFVDTDTELALVLSHELAHNAMGHIEKKKRNALAAGAGGLVVDALFAVVGVNTNGAFTDMAADAGANKHSVAFEQEADYVGMYFMERAGHDISGVANFWRRMASENSDASIDDGGSHPSSPERFVAIEKIYKEIKHKKYSGKPLAPELDVKKDAQERIQVRTAYND